MASGLSSIVLQAPHRPVFFRGEAYHAQKMYWHGSQRSIAPEETFEKIRPHFRTIGLTRLCNITGLDRIGIPTVLSVRPNSGYLSVDAGKGFTPIAAMVSAAMECFERYAAEAVRPPELKCSWNDLGTGPSTIPLHRLPLARNSLFRPNRLERWTLGWDLIQQKEVFVPVMLVTMERHRCTLAESISFQLSSNGLSSGNNFLESICGGILEVIERDAVACCRIAWETGGCPPPRVRLDTVEHLEACEVIERLDRAGIRVVLFDCTVDTGVPTYMAYLFDRLVPRMGVYRGYGTHLDPAIAMVRALTEAVQGRLIFIAGSRDDAFRHHRRFQDEWETTLQAIDGIEATADARQRTSLATSTFEGDVQVLLEKLVRAGLDQVIVFDLSMPETGVSVVRVIVPGLEGYMFETYSPGSRGKASLDQAKAGQTR